MTNINTALISLKTQITLAEKAITEARQRLWSLYLDGDEAAAERDLIRQDIASYTGRLNALHYAVHLIEEAIPEDQR